MVKARKDGFTNTELVVCDSFSCLSFLITLVIISCFELASGAFTSFPYAYAACGAQNTWVYQGWCCQVSPGMFHGGSAGACRGYCDASILYVPPVQYPMYKIDYSFSHPGGTNARFLFNLLIFYY